MEPTRQTALVKQIEDYNLSNKLKDLADKQAARRPFRHLPKQFSKGILIGNIAIVPRKVDDSRFVYVIADMVSAEILYDSINLKQTAILVAHYLADGKNIPHLILHIDQHFASKIFEIKNFKRFVKAAQREGNDMQEFIYTNKMRETNRQADELKREIQLNFEAVFGMNFAK
jgi:hypothetical protein